MLKRILLILVLASVLVGISSITAQDFGFNWTGTFYNNRDFSDSAAATITNISGLNFNWTGQPIINGAVIGAVRENNFSARFTSTQTFQSGNYRFTVTWDDQVRVLFDGQTVFDDFSLDGIYPKSRTFDREIVAGAHNLVVELVERSDVAQLQFQWQLLGPAATVGPSPTPGPTSTPAPTGLPSIPGGSLSATVIRASVLNVRSGPFLGADRVGRILRGQTYAVVARDDDARWFLLQLSDKQAWAYGYYLAINGNEFNAATTSAFVTLGNPAASTGVVAQTFAGLKLRAQPTIYSEQIGRIDWGQILPVLARTPGDGAWWQVIYKDTVGWVFAPYLKLIEGEIKDVPTIEG